MKQSKCNLCFIVENKLKNFIVKAGKIPLGKEEQMKEKLNNLYPLDNFQIKYVPVINLCNHLNFEQIHELDFYFSHKHTSCNGSDYY